MQLTDQQEFKQQQGLTRNIQIIPAQLTNTSVTFTQYSCYEFRIGFMQENNTLKEIFLKN